MGFRKGADVDEELWPTEEFGGVSDEQFWDDLAVDQPLTTTARTAQQHRGTRKRPLNRNRGGSRGAGSGAYPEPGTSPTSATELTVIQSPHATTQPVPSIKPQVLGATQVPGVAQPVKTAAGGSQPASAASRPAGAGGSPARAVGRPTGVAAQPAETRGRRRASSAEEDPLTSAAFSLRPSGPVDGRSSLRAGGSWSGGPGPGSASTYGGTQPGSPNPYAGASYGDPPSATRAMNTPPRGESYGYGSRSPAPSADNSRRPNGTRSHARPTGAGQGTRPVRQAYPPDGYPAGNGQGASGYHATGGYSTRGYPGDRYPGSGGHPANGQHAPYHPRHDYPRLTHRR